jgi:hypothetical protein
MRLFAWETSNYCSQLRGLTPVTWGLPKTLW